MSQGIAERYPAVSKRMVEISLLTLAPGRMGGSERYARGLTSALARHGRHEYVVALPPDIPDAAGGLPFVTAGAPSATRRPRAFAQAAVARYAFEGSAVVHYPLTVPLPYSRRSRVVTLHDVLHRDLPLLVPRHVRAFRALAYDLAARRADRVIVPSAFVRERAVARLGLDRGRVHVVPHGVDHDVFYPDARAREPFLLYPARRWPHKNHAFLFGAFSEIRRDRPELELVLTGERDTGSALPDGVRSLGYVSIEELAELYRRAAALVFPSRYEGFGWPVLEAMASGCPVAAASGTAVEEVAGNAAVFFAPDATDQAVEAVERALANTADLSARGIARATIFTWERVAQQHDEVYGDLS
jgi:glycosyltransferase involved in cell wall biosynthesis